MYAVTCMRHGKQVPTFYLNANVQGIVDVKHAEEIALEVLGTDGIDGLCVVMLGTRFTSDD